MQNENMQLTYEFKQIEHIGQGECKPSLDVSLAGSRLHFVAPTRHEGNRDRGRRRGAALCPVSRAVVVVGVGGGGGCACGGSCKLAIL